MSESTPGPWFFDCNEWPAIIRNSEGLHIAEVLPQGPDRDGNGYVLAAAPDLLDALIECTDWLNNYGGTAGRDVALRQLPVIEKARGQEST